MEATQLVCGWAVTHLDFSEMDGVMEKLQRPIRIQVLHILIN